MSFHLKMPARILLGVAILAPLAWFAWTKIPEQGSAQPAQQQPAVVEVQPQPQPAQPQQQAPVYAPAPQAASQTGNNAGLNALIQRGQE